jgi:hypothetical protein
MSRRSTFPLSLLLDSSLKLTPAALIGTQDIAKGQGEAFSTLVSLVLLTANLLRLFFW